MLHDSAAEEAVRGSLLIESRRHGELQPVGGRVRLALLGEQVPTAANLGHYARIVRRLACQRQLAMAVSTWGAQVTDPGSDLDRLKDQSRVVSDAVSTLLKASANRLPLGTAIMAGLRHGIDRMWERS